MLHRVKHEIWDFIRLRLFSHKLGSTPCGRSSSVQTPAIKVPNMVKTLQIHCVWGLCMAVVFGLTLAVGPAYADEPRRNSLRIDEIQPSAGGTLRFGRSTLIARDQEHERARSGVNSGEYVPLSTVLTTIRRQYEGKQLNTRTIGGGGPVPMRYVVRWLTPDGRRLDITADASTGRIISVRGD
jgi:hypothetical protein